MIFRPWIGFLFVTAALLILFADDIAYALQRLSRFRDSESALRLRLSELPIVRRFVRRGRFQTDLTEIRDFMASLQLAASLGETLSGGLTAAAEQFAHRGVFGERLKRQVESRLSISPEAVLRDWPRISTPRSCETCSAGSRWPEKEALPSPRRSR
jgi:hypothetical protein